MEMVRLASSDLAVSRIGLGCEPLGESDCGTVDVDLAMRAVSESLSFGVNVFDTADIYGLGRSEQLLSVALGTHRNSAAIITKFGMRWKLNLDGSRATTFRDASSKWVKESVEHSLRRLRLECIPVYLVHWPDPETPLAETMEALERCRLAGKIRHIGVSNFSAKQIRVAHSVAPLTLAELPYSLVDRRCESDVLGVCLQLGISVMAYSTLGRGVLTGKYKQGHEFGTDDRRQRLPQFQGDSFSQNLQITERLREVGLRYGKSPSQVAIRWVLQHPAITCAIVGAKTPCQVEEDVDALGWTLAPHDYQYLASEGLRAHGLTTDRRASRTSKSAESIT